MATIRDPKMVQQLLMDKGRYENDPQVQRLYVYTNPNAPGEHYAVFYRTVDDDMHRSPFVKNAILLLREGGVLTPGGIAWLATQQRPSENDIQDLRSCFIS